MKQVTARFKASLALKFTIIAAVMLVFVGIYVYDGFRFTSHIKGEALLIEKAGNLRFRSFEMAWWLRRIVVEQDAATKKAHIKHLLLEAGRFDEIAAYLLTTFEAKDKRHYGETAKELDKLVDSWNNGLKQLVLSIPESSGHNQKLLMDRYEALIHPYVYEVDLFVKTHALHMENELDAYGSRRAASLAVLAGIFILLIAFAKKGLIAPIQSLRDAAIRIGSGEYGLNIAVKNRDELGELTASFNLMAQRLATAFEELNLSRGALIYSEAAYRSAVELLPKTVWVYKAMLDDRASTIYVSPQIKTLGFSQEEWLAGGDYWSRQLHPDDRERVLAEFRNAAAAAAAIPFTCEYRLLTRDAEVRWFRDVAHIVKDEGGGFFFFQGVVSDITEIKVVEMALTESVARLADAQKIGRIGSFEREILSGKLYWSEELYRILGLAPNEFPATFQAFLDVIHPEDLEFFKETIETAINEKKPFELDYRVVLPDGSERVVNVHGEAVFDSSGRALKTRGTVQDITERKQAEEELRRLTSIIELTSDFVATGDMNKQVLYYNKAARRMLGIEDDEDISRVRIEDTHPQWAGELVLNEGIPSAIRDGIWIGETAFLSRRGEEIPALQTIIVHKSPKGELLYISTIARDISVLKKIENELRERNLLLQTLIDSIPDMFYYKDIQGRYMIVNNVFAEFAGLSKEEVTGKAPEELFSTETAKAARESDEVVFMTVKPLRFEYPTFDRQGHKMVLDIIKTPVLAGSGEIIGMLGIFRDITEKKKIEDTIKSSRDFYLELFNKFPQPFRRTDSYGRCNYVNRAWLKRTGQEFEESLSYGWVAALHTADREATMNEFLIAFNARQPVVLTYRISSRDGQYRWIIEYGTPFNGPDGKFAGYICSCHDFTERKKIEEALAQSENRFKQFFEQNEIAIMLLDPLNCAICEANHAAVGLYGYTREELIAQGLALLISPVLLDGFKEVVRNSILSQGAEGFSILPQFHTRKDGSSAIVVVHAKSIRLSPEETPVLYCSFFDITATIRLQEEGKVRQAQLIHSNKMASVGLMISGVVHEINNPNAFIMSNAQLMQDISQEVLQLLERLYKAQPDISIAGLSFPEIREAAPRLVSGIIDASTRINEIVRNIGDFVRPESEDMEKKFDINSAILTSTAILTNQIKKCTDNFHLDLNKGLPLIRGSSQKLEQVIINLVMNSLQALPDRGRGVYVSTARDEDTDCVIIEIRDEGRGMQEENMNRIKEPFFTTKSEAGGTGLGLFISDEIIRKHNGSLSFESEQGKGTTAIIRLPIEGEL